MDSIGSPAGGLTSPAPAHRVGRDGGLELRFDRRGSTTVLSRSRSTLPLQVLAPLVFGDPAAVVSMLNPTGGLVGGDRLTVDVEVGPGAHACLTTPSATKVYRTTGPLAEHDVRLRIGPRGTLEWVPDHTIPHAGSALRQRITAELDEGARLILVDAFAAGRIARGEAWAFASLDSAVSVRDRRGPRLYDRFLLDDGRPWDGLGATEGDPYFATAVVVGDGDSAVFRDRAARILLGRPRVRGGVGVLPRGGVLVRLLASSAPALLDVLDALWGSARVTVLGLSPLPLRKL